MYFDWFLVRDISLPAAQLFVIAIEIILGRGVGNLTRNGLQSSTVLPRKSGHPVSPNTQVQITVVSGYQG